MWAFPKGSVQDFKINAGRTVKTFFNFLCAYEKKDG